MRKANAMPRSVRSRRDQLMIGSALCGAVAAALLAAAPARAATAFPQPVPGLVLASGAKGTNLTTANFDLPANSICAGGAACTATTLATNATGPVTPPETTIAFFAREEGRFKVPVRLVEAVGKAGGYDAALARDEVVGDAVEGDGLAFDCDGF